MNGGWSCVLSSEFWPSMTLPTMRRASMWRKSKKHLIKVSQITSVYRDLWLHLRVFINFLVNSDADGEYMKLLLLFCLKMKMLYLLLMQSVIAGKKCIIYIYIYKHFKCMCHWFGELVSLFGVPVSFIIYFTWRELIFKDRQCYIYYPRAGMVTYLR